MRVLGPGRTFRGHHSGAANSARAQTVMSEPSHPLVSVVVPTCNRADLLRRCLDRLAPGAQRLDAARYEVIVADDGAPGSAAMAIEKTHPWARTVGVAFNFEGRGVTGPSLLFETSDGKASLVQGFEIRLERAVK